MPKSPQDIYARHLLSPRGYPLWTPEPSHQLLTYRRDGLRIGDVGVVIPEDGCFDVFFNLCLPHDHPFHQATGVPDNFKPIRLTDMDLRTVTNAENPGRIIATSSVKTVSTVERSGDTSSRTRSSGLEYEFNLASSEGALLILPEGAERQDLRNYHLFLEAATQHGADWYRFAEEKVGQIIGHDSLYLITGLHKTFSWSLAAFEKTAGSGEYPAHCRLPQLGGGNITATCTWNTARALDWRVGPVDNYGIPNQAVFIRGFKIARRTGMLGRRWISVRADVPSTTKPSHVNYFGAVPGDSDSWLGYIFGGQSGGRSVEPSRNDIQDEIAVDPELHAARNEIQNYGALAVGEDIVIHRMPEASQAFHPSDIINQYLLNKEPSANIAVTHDDEWIALLEKNMIRSEDLVQGSLLEGLVSQNYHVVLEAGAVYLRSRSAGGPLALSPQENPFLNSDSGTSNVSEVDATMEARKCDSDNPASVIVDEISSAELGDVTTLHVPQDIPRINPYSFSSNDPQDDSQDDRAANEVLFSNAMMAQGKAGDTVTIAQASLNQVIATLTTQGQLEIKDKSTLQPPGIMEMSSSSRSEQEYDVPQIAVNLAEPMMASAELAQVPHSTAKSKKGSKPKFNASANEGGSAGKVSTPTPVPSRGNASTKKAAPATKKGRKVRFTEEPDADADATVSPPPIAKTMTKKGAQDSVNFMSKVAIPPIIEEGDPAAAQPLPVAPVGKKTPVAKLSKPQRKLSMPKSEFKHRPARTGKPAGVPAPVLATNSGVQAGKKPAQQQESVPEPEDNWLPTVGSAVPVSDWFSSGRVRYLDNVMAGQSEETEIEAAPDNILTNTSSPFVDSELVAWRQQAHGQPQPKKSTELFGEPMHRPLAATPYGPSLEPTSPKYAGGTIKLHPLLAASPNERGEYPSWAMCFLARPDHFRVASPWLWVNTLSAPATQPHRKSIRIISRAFPGTIHAQAEINIVTCGDVLSAIWTFLDEDMQWGEYEQFTRDRLKTTVKSGAVDTLKRSSWLGTNLLFGGLVPNDAFVKEDMSPSCFELICLSKPRQ